MIVTGKQIRAARVLAEWDRPDLADKAGVSLMTIQNIELDTKQPRPATLDKIVGAFSEAGIEFIENEGVRLKPTGIEVYDGVGRFNEFNDFLYDHLRSKGGEVCVNIYDETLVTKYRKNPELHRKRMKELIERGDVTFRVLATKSDFIAYDYVQFKWHPQQHPTPTGFYAFGDCLALMSFVNAHSPYVVVIQSSPLAEGYRQSFNIAWQNASEPPNKGGGK